MEKPSFNHLEDTEPFDEPLMKGEELKGCLEICRQEAERVLADNPALAPENIRIVLDRSLNLEVIPAAPVAVATKHIARSEARLETEELEPFELVLATAIPVIKDNQLELTMHGNSYIQEDGLFKVYKFNPLLGHSYRARRVREVTDTPFYKSGIRIRTDDVTRSFYFTVY